MDEFLLICLTRRRIIVFITSISVVRKLSIAIAVALVGGILAPLATATSASADTPLNGDYVCTTGMRQVLRPLEYIPTYTITDGIVKDGGSCAGNVVIPAGVTSIGNYAFYFAPSVTSITIPASVTNIGNKAFEHASSLTSITIPAGVTSIGDSAFYGATKLTSITVDAGNQNFTSIDGVLFNKDATTLIQYPLGKTETKYSIPAGVTSIGESAIEQASSLTSITIPASVASIGDYAFASTALNDVYFLSNAPSVGDDTFYGIASGAIAHISATATGFGSESTWYGLIVIVSVKYTVSYDSANGTVVAAGSFTTGGSIQTAPVSTRAGYTLSGWSTSANGSVVTFPYSPTATTDITLYAIWTPIPVKATYASGVKLTGKAKVSKSITVAPGSWTGTVPITYKYQWYSCKVASTKVLKTGKVAPKCTVIKKATRASFKVTTKEKGSFLAVKITGSNSVGSSRIFTATVGKVS